MGHVVLLGDSIFDNARYVPGDPPVIEQVRTSLPPGWRATLLAVDGHMTDDVVGQLERLPADATHLFVSVGGNDAIGASDVLADPARSVAEALTRMADVQNQFRYAYHAMLQAVRESGKPTIVCTIYDAIPGLTQAAVTALGLINEIILRAAFSAGLPVIDLRLVCDRAEDYSAISPIEPSTLGGAKIARVMAEIATNHDFSRRRSVVYS